MADQLLSFLFFLQLLSPESRHFRKIPPSCAVKRPKISVQQRAEYVFFFFFLNAVGCSEVRICASDGRYFSDSTTENSSVCQMKVRTCDGQVGRQRSWGLMKQLVGD